MKLYQTVAQELERMIRGGTLRPGDRLPSVRALSATRRVSHATVLHAYATLESMRLIEPRERSGYYVSTPVVGEPSPRPSTPVRQSTRVAVSDLVYATLQASRDRGVVPLGSAFPSPTLFPWKKLARFLGSSARHMDPWSTVESLPPGSLDLRRAIARRYLKLGMTVEVDDIIVTAGALEALNLALQAVTRPGDTIAIESPTFYGCLQSAERLGLQVVEIPTHPQEGMDVDALAGVLRRQRIAACWLMTSLQNPTGASMPVERKKALVQLLTEHSIPLIEDDAYAELQFAASPTVPAKAFDSEGWILHCGSFSKCLAPGYRLGWVTGGRFAERINRLKAESSIGTSLPIQQGIAHMLQQGSYDSHLLALRQSLESQQAAALQAIRRHFPPGYRVARPAGGYFLWIECAPDVNSLDVHRRALASGISIAPGPMFSARRQFGHFIRLNCGYPWTARWDQAIERVGRLLRV